MSLKIGITLGDPAGIGPEITARALPDLKGHLGNMVLIGNRDNFMRVSEAVDVPVEIVDEVQFVDIPSEPFAMGEVSEVAGYNALRSIETAVGMALSGEVAGICTAPINKEAIILAGSEYKDHTTMLSGLTNSGELSTVFETGELRVTFLTKHLSLRDAISAITEESVYRGIVKADQAMRLLGINGGKIAVSALNPHGGEGGLFGDEEINAIRPAVEKAAKKYNVQGPFPADSVFFRASQGEFQMVLSMYHDQGHIAAKMLDFHHTVSMNTGMPFLRTSVDHGTAFDIAGKFHASGESMKEAIMKALSYSEKYRKNFSSIEENMKK